MYFKVKTFLISEKKHACVVEPIKEKHFDDGQDDFWTNERSFFTRPQNLSGGVENESARTMPRLWSLFS